MKTSSAAKLGVHVLKTVLVLVTALFVTTPVLAQGIEYRVLATSKTSTMEKEMNDAGAAGFKFAAVMGGQTAAGGNEVVVLMQRGGDVTGTFRYRLLATNRTSTMQKELNDAALDGYDYLGQSVFKSAFGGEEVVLIVERGAAAESAFMYQLIATSKTSTLQKEAAALGLQGFQALGLTVGKTALGGSELVVIARKKK